MVFGKKKKGTELKFRLELHLALNSVPLANEDLFVRWKCRAALGEREGRTAAAPVTAAAAVVWEEPLVLHVSLHADVEGKAAGELRPAPMTLAVLLQPRTGKKPKELGLVDVDVCRWVAPAGTGRAETNARFLLQDSVLNAALAVVSISEFGGVEACPKNGVRANLQGCAELGVALQTCVE